LGLPKLNKLLDHARREVAAGETFLEFRLDYLTDPMQGARAIRTFLDEYPECTILATCRRHHNHGRFEGSIDDELTVLSQAIQCGAHAVDVEVETAELVPDRLPELRVGARLIISYHNFDSTPPIEPIVKRLTRYPADAYKLVTTA